MQAFFGRRVYRHTKKRNEDGTKMVALRVATKPTEAILDGCEARKYWLAGRLAYVAGPNAETLIRQRLKSLHCQSVRDSVMASACLRGWLIASGPNFQRAWLPAPRR